MKCRLIVCLALVLNGVLFGGNASHAGESATNSAVKTYQNINYGFKLAVPRDWTVTETNFEVFHYNEVFLAINSRRPNLTLQEQWVSTNTIEYNGDIASGQLQPGEAYISIGYLDGPGGTEMFPDRVADTLTPLLDANPFRTFPEPKLSELELLFFKRGHNWNISAYLRQPATATVSNEVMNVLKSFQFLDAPVGNVAWAESLAWEQLPENIRKFNHWPVSDGVGMRPVWGRNTVLIEKADSGYRVHFTLTGLGTWEYAVSEDGKVEAGTSEVNAPNPSSSEMPSDLPGQSQGKIDAHWADPYVEVTEALGKTTTTRFDHDDNTSVTANTNQASYAEFDVKPGRVTLHGVEPGQASLHIYRNGSLVNTIGPFVACYPSYEPAVNDDGSAALLAWNDESETGTRIFVFNTNGDIRFQTDCGPDIWSPIPAPGGAGVLIRPNGGTNANMFTWFTEKGQMCSLTINWNPEFVGWIPHTYKSLFKTGVGFETDFQLIDWSTGKRLWSIPCPGGELLTMNVSPTLILLSVAEPSPTGVWRKVNDSLLQSGNEWVRSFYALNVDDGRVVAHWRGQFPHRWYDSDHDHFSQMGNRLFYVTADEFTEINIEDILAKKNGWH
jgi:hypothetical protein